MRQTRSSVRPRTTTALGTFATLGALAAGAATLAGGISPGLAGQHAPGAAPTAPYLTWIETRASQVFDRSMPQLRGLQVGYRVDAHILLPLGFASVELWNRPGVGIATASYRDCESESGEVLRAFELFSSSDPERAHGFDRCGFFREALRVTPSGVAWTVYFGAMTSWPETTLSEARKSASSPQPHTYEAIDGLSAPLEGRASVFLVSTQDKLPDSAALWSALRPQLESTAPHKVLSMVGTPVRPLPALGFLGAVQETLRSAAARRAKPPAPSATRVRFVHNGLVRQLEIASMSPDTGRGRRAVAAGFARTASDVFEIRYRIINPGEDDFEFKLWAELPAGTANEPLTPPLPPLAWELRLRSYLKLSFERVS